MTSHSRCPPTATTGCCNASTPPAPDSSPRSWPTATSKPSAGPTPEVLQILDPRPLLDEAAAIGARYHAAGLLVGETLAAGLSYGHQLWFGTQRNVGTRLAEIADDLHIAVRVIEPA